MTYKYSEINGCNCIDLLTWQSHLNLVAMENHAENEKAGEI